MVFWRTKIFIILYYSNEFIGRLGEIICDGLIEVSEHKITVKEEGRMFVRNIYMAFDLRLVENEPDIRIFSMTI